MNALDVATTLNGTPLTSFLDHPFTEKNLKEAFKEKVEFSNLFKILTSPLNLNPLKLVKKLYQTTGVCKGETFHKWIEDLIQQYTKIENCTFGELAELVYEEPSKYHHLHVFTACVGKKPQLRHFVTGVASTSRPYQSAAPVSAGGLDLV